MVCQWYLSSLCLRQILTFIYGRFFRNEVLAIDSKLLPLNDGESVTSLLNELCPVIFDPTILPKRVDKSDGKDIVRSSACNYYDGVSQYEVEEFYAKLKKDGPTSEAPSYGLNSTLVKEGDSIREVYGSLVANIMQQSKRLYIG